MGFTASISFTGACGIVPKSNPSNPPEAFCIVLPNAWDPDPNFIKPSAVDQTPMCRHVAFVQFAKTDPIATVPMRQELDCLWFLQNHRLFIEPVFDGSPSAASYGKIDGLASYEDVSSPDTRDLLSVKKAVQSPDPNVVIAQVIVKNGRLDCDILNSTFVFDDYLRQQLGFSQKKLNFKATVTIDNLKSLNVVRKTFAGDAVDSYSFFDGPALITVANLCDPNPLQWGDSKKARLTDDEDFRLHYELVDDCTALGNELDPCRCPIPRVARGAHNGNGLNCMPIRFSGVNFNY
jgi:hypothetical protein